MYCGQCCVTEARLRAAPQLDIFIEILLGCEYTGEWLWATSWTGLTLLLGEPKVHCK
jgi:hypothetical protein